MNDFHTRLIAFVADTSAEGNRTPLTPEAAAALEASIRRILSRSECRHEIRMALTAVGYELPPEREHPLHKESIAVLKLFNRASSELEGSGIITVGQLVDRTREELLRMPNLGPKYVREIEAKLAVRGLRLRYRRPTLEELVRQFHSTLVERMEVREELFF